MIYISLFILSFVLIWKSADYFVDSSHALAAKLNLSPFVIGATVVAFGTSAPELFVNIFAAIDQQPNIIYGNILGSNLANTLLILGSACILTPILINHTSRSQILINLLFTFLISTLLYFQFINRVIGICVLVVFFIYYYRLLNQSTSDSTEVSKNGRSTVQLIVLFIVSLLVLVGASKLMIFSLLESANILGLSTMFLSLFAVALGTSLPELISTILFVKKGHSEMVIGNVFGSNLFNIMLVLPISWLVLPLKMPFNLLFELKFLLFILLVLFVSSFIFKRYYRFSGIVLLALYFTYTAYIYLR